jgi:ribosomal protein S18 acetylase RimI-like enzyme
MIKEITDIHTVDLSGLLEESRRNHQRMIVKLIEQWESGENDFGKENEKYWGYFSEDRLIGVGGVNEDPYLKKNIYGRMRHLWVLEAFRRRGIGKALVVQAIEFSKNHYETMTLRTPKDGSADLFYEKLGFERCDWLENVSHIYSFR